MTRLATILVADDNPTDRQLMAAILVPRGHRVVEASDGVTALELVGTDPPDLIVSDILMPRMDGYQLARTVRSAPDTASIPVAFYTANRLEPRMTSLARTCGVTLFIQKPSEPEEILRVVEAALGSPPQAPTAQAEEFDREHLELLSEALLRRVEELDRANRRLTRSEERFRSLIEAAPDAVLGVDERGRIRIVNARTEELFGYPREELLGASVEILIPERHRTGHVSHRASYGRAPEPRLMGANREVSARRKDGSEFHASVNLSTIDTDDGTVVIASVRDISERVRGEQERALLEAQLQQAQRLESVGQLAGGVAHDFNNLLMVITNYADWALEQLDPGSPVRPDVEEIRRAADRAAALTHQLLIFSRREVVNPEVLDLNTVVTDMENLLARTLGEHIELTTRLSPDPAPALVDPGEMEQVLLNLVMNARDSMPDGGRLQIELSMLHLDEERWPGLDAAGGDYVRLAVTDTGVGMTPELMDRAFEPFFTTKPKGQGTGLGLSTVYGIATHAGGNVKLYSEPGRGTTAAVYLPRADAPPRERPVPAPEADGGNGEVILLVEDEDGVRDITRRILSESGYEVIAASSGDAALEHWASRGREIDAVVTDVVMPGLSGKELAVRIRSDRPEVAVVFMSGYPSDFVGHSVDRDRSVTLLRKPFGRATLLASVRAAIDGGARVEAVSDG